nr:hypothetical protein [Desulfobacterales bacterium]
MNSVIEDRLAAIEQDKKRGAVQLAAEAIRVLMLASHEVSAPDTPQFLSKMKEIVLRISKCRPSMAPLTNWGLIFYERLLDSILPDFTPVEAANAAERIGLQLLEEQNAILMKMVDVARSLLRSEKVILTLSYSSTVEAILSQAAPLACQIIVAESRPLLEGRRLVLNLKEKGFSVRCITDAEVSYFVRDVSLVLLGADSICNDLSAINKVGSLAAALAAQEYKKPCTIAADTLKIDPLHSSETIELEEKTGDEVWPEHPHLCINIYFEPIPRHLITSYITEKGVFDADRMFLEVTRWKELREKMMMGHITG